MTNVQAYVSSTQMVTRYSCHRITLPHDTTPAVQTRKRRRQMKGSPARRLAATLAAAMTMKTPLAVGGAAAGAEGSGARNRPR
jgi:hypothetical protein